MQILYIMSYRFTQYRDHNRNTQLYRFIVLSMADVIIHAKFDFNFTLTKINNY